MVLCASQALLHWQQGLGHVKRQLHTVHHRHTASSGSPHTGTGTGGGGGDSLLSAPLSRAGSAALQASRSAGGAAAGSSMLAGISSGSGGLVGMSGRLGTPTYAAGMQGALLSSAHASDASDASGSSLAQVCHGTLARPLLQLCTLMPLLTPVLLLVWQVCLSLFMASLHPCPI